jgi:hypothetical protein
MSPRWRPWEPADEYEEAFYFLDQKLSALAGEYRANPVLAKLEAGVLTPYVADSMGNPHPRALLVGEAPGKDEDAQGEPFVGASGQLLDALLAEFSIDRNRWLYRTNLIKARPVDESGHNRTPTEVEQAEAAGFLRQEIELIGAPIVVTLGNVPLQAVWPDAPRITACHGVPRVLPNGRVHLPAVHPSYALRGTDGERLLRHDVAVLAQLLAATRVVLVTGSRECTRASNVHEVLDAELRRDGPFTLRHGACPSGVDRFADDWGRANADRVIVDRMPADWSGPRGNGAGFARNQAMVDRGAERCHAFIWNDSRGASDCADRAEAAGIEVVRHRVISRFFGRYAGLSNFYRAPIDLGDDATYPTNEHAFQAMKSTDPLIHRSVASAETPREAKELGRSLSRRPDWEQIKEQVMLDLCRLKFATHPDLRDLLLSTGDAYLEEGNDWGDREWGTVGGQGQNKLGHILMRVRAELAAADPFAFCVLCLNGEHPKSVHRLPAPRALPGELITAERPKGGGS